MACGSRPPTRSSRASRDRAAARRPREGDRRGARLREELPRRGRAAAARARGSPGVERVAEIGTGTGVGTAWLASALPPGVRLFTAERDERLAGAAAELFADDPDVDVLRGDWRKVLPRARRST